MQHQISVITLGVDDLATASRFYQDGFGWEPVFQNEEIVFYQMNGVILGTFLAASLAADMNQPAPFQRPGAFALAHNVTSADGVQPVMDALLAAGGTLLRAADAPPHGGLRGYVADPDGHAWEIAWQPMVKIAADGRVSFEF
ncbi:VOC family protein [Acuticoccus sp. I52.16.1]|uniref:VOC family protein n=1 Tax=Acuticoccus sp. I52.16.1 TaxID=2928472 RepID=UPI001FD31356|nr:VOC family protein [Acuticoccus sp. I52.16.1]UOM36325.1 VOC family protein [Acuticoccus sp. I52.16.1]